MENVIVFRNSGRKLAAWFSGLALVGLAGCSSVQPEQIDPTADVQGELAKTGVDLESAKAQQVDVLAPKNFKLAREEFNDAKKMRDGGKDSDRVFETLGRSRAYLKLANDSATMTRTGLTETTKNRQAAVAAGAERLRAKELKDLDAALVNVTDSAESGNVEKIRREDEMLSKKYAALELDTIKEANLGSARGQIKQAEKEDAKKWSSRTLEQVNGQYAALDEFISSNRHDPSIAQKASELNAASDRLLLVTRESKKYDKTDAEALVLDRERIATDLAAQKKALDAKAQQLDSTSSALQTAEQRAGNLAAVTAANAAFEQKFEEARSSFTSEEAEVFRQADVLTIRLKTLAFKTGDAGLGNQSFPILQKVQGVISKFESPRITIEGHTDSTGNKARNMTLSQTRAESVANYLVAQGVPQASISTVGYGFDKPIASNKTKAGRLQNRRVDVVIDSRRESASLK